MRGRADAGRACRSAAIAMLVLTGVKASAATTEPADLPQSLASPGIKTGAPSRMLYLKLIANMREAGKAHAALAHLDAFDKQYPRQPEAALLRGDCLVDIGDYANAGVIYGKLLRGSQAAAAYAGLGRIEAFGERWPGAADEFARAVALAPVSAEYLNDYGFALVRAGRGNEGLFRLRQAGELAPNNAKVRNNLIIALAATGNDVEAKRLLATIAGAEERRQIEAAMLTTMPPRTP